MTEALITDLAKIGALKVISRSSSMRYKGTDKPLAEIADELDVDVVVEGSALRVDGSVRIMAQLIDPETEQALWAESYEQDLENVLLLWSEVAQAIAGEVQVALTPEETKRLAGARPVNPEAHDAYLKGSYHWKNPTPANLDTAQSYFELALEKDPSYASAYAGVAWVWAARQQFNFVPPHEAGPKGKTAALQAIALDDSSAEAYGALGVIRTWTDWDWDGAGQAWRRALELDPNAANTHAYYAHFLAITLRIDEAIPHSERAIELDPFNALFHNLYSMVLRFDRRYDDAIAAARTGGFGGFADQALESALVSTGMRDKHLALQRKRITSDPERLAALEQGFAEGGYEGAMRHVADLLAARYEKSRGIKEPGSSIRSQPPWVISAWYLFAGDYEKAIDWLEKGYDVHHPQMPYIGADPRWDPLRSDPRFQDLLRRMNLPTTSASSDRDQQR
jgi:tetratricopeptide (TPR) repeat protein